jgi:hypothetical protein
MRTTLDLEKPVLDGLKELQRKEKQSLGKIASRLLAEALATRAGGVLEEARLEWSSAPMQAKVDLADKDALYRAMEGA